MNFEKARIELDAEIVNAERTASLPLPVITEMTDVEKVILDRLIAKLKVHDMKVEHALLFGATSPYFHLL